MTRIWPRVPAGTRVVVIGGPFTQYDYPFYILPAFAQATWGPDITLADTDPGTLPAQIAIATGGPRRGVRGRRGILRSLQR